MSKHICVTVDTSPLSLHALPAAGTIARPGDVIELVTAVDPVPPFSLPGYAAAAAQWVDKRHAEVTPLLGVEGCEVRSTHLERAPRGLAEFFEERRPDVLVIATHGRGPVSRNWLGSTTDRLLRGGTTPLLVVRPEGDGEPDPGDWPPIRKVLVPLDGSELAEQAVDGALAIFGDEIALTLVRIVEAGHLPGSPYLPDQIRDRKEAVEEAQRYMEQAVTGIRSRSLRVEGHVRSGDRASSEIVAAAADVDVIALATHGRGGLTRATLGSVADKVIRLASRPVLVLPAGGARR
ncbi:MAG: universal stress protein [Gemmatimonadota bacterium]|nr:universal stress protein [Gemmatimonadota bacterium]